MNCWNVSGKNVMAKNVIAKDVIANPVQSKSAMATVVALYRARWEAPSHDGGAAGGRREDDGYLIGFVHDEARESSELLILDARTMDEKPVARVTIPGRVPHGFHALWVPDDEGEEHHPRSKLF